MALICFLLAHGPVLFFVAFLLFFFLGMTAGLLCHENSREFNWCISNRVILIESLCFVFVLWNVVKLIRPNVTCNPLFEILNSRKLVNTSGHALALWLKHCAPNRKVEGLIPDGVIGIFH
jgi:hypothetical protein